MSREKVRRILFPCRVKGCSWRGEGNRTCPMHPEQAWDSQPLLMPDHVVSKAQTRHRN